MNTISSPLRLVPATSIPFTTPISEENMRDSRVKKAIRWLRENVAQPISLRSLAIDISISPRHLTRLFKGETNYAPMHYLHELRFEQAWHLLQSSDLQIKEICYRVGFEDVCNFKHEFKKRQGCTPCEFREREQIKEK